MVIHGINNYFWVLRVNNDLGEEHFFPVVRRMVFGVTQWIGLILGSVVTGEALALLVGMNLPSPRVSAWSTLKNNGLALVDVITGIVLIYVFWRKNVLDRSIYLIVFTLILVLHGYRSWEYFYIPFNRFCVNRPLFIVNNVKLFTSFFGVLFCFVKR